MKNKITHITPFNYEAYYLDYLEGNLSEEDVLLFESFLKKNPELIVLDDDLPFLDLTKNTLKSENFNFLKQIDTESDKITDSNVELFILHLLDGQLNPSKEKELYKFLNENSTYKELYDEYLLTKLPNEIVTYPDKVELKKKNIVAFNWIQFAAAIFIGILLTIYFVNSNRSINSGTNDYVATKKSSPKEQPIQPTKKVEKYNVTPQVAVNSSKTKIERVPEQVKTNLEHDQLTIAQINPTDDSIVPLKVRPLTRELPYLYNNQDVVVVHIEEEKQKNEGVNYALGFSNKPIEPITKELSRIFDQTIDLRTADKNKDSKEGFYVKIGKLEIYHKKSKK